MVKSILLTACFLFSSHILFGQKVVVAEASENLENVARAGLYTDIELIDYRTVEKAWERHLKTYGRVTNSKGYYALASANVYELSSKPVTIYSQIRSTIKGAHIWWAIDLGDSYASTSSNADAYKRAEKILHAFAVDCYKYDVNEQIKEAEKAVIAAEKFHEKEVKHGDQLVRNIEKNKLEKIKLEEQLKQNAADLEQLKRDTEINKVVQRDALLEIEKMKRGLVVVKEKINLIQ